MSGPGADHPTGRVEGHPTDGIPAIVLAAGAGRRFGAPKQTARLDGRPLLAHVVDTLTVVPGVGEVIVVLGAHSGIVVREVDLRAVRTVHCEDWAQGMSASLRAGVAALEGGTDAALVLLADQPRITAQVIALVADAAARTPGVDAVRAAYDGVPGHPVVLRRTLLSRVGELHDDAGARDLLASTDVRLVEVGRLCDPADVDTPQDLDALEAITR